MENNFNIFHFEKNGTAMVEMTKDDFTGLIAEITTNSIDAAKTCEHKEDVTTVVAKPQSTYRFRVTITVDIEDGDSSIAMGRAVDLAATAGHVVSAELFEVADF